MTRTDIAGEIAVQLWECEYCRERLAPEQSKFRQTQLREAIELGRAGWRRP